MEKHLKKNDGTIAQWNVYGCIYITRYNAHVGSGNYNPPISFCELSLDGSGHMIQIGEWLSEDIRRETSKVRR